MDEAGVVTLVDSGTGERRASFERGVRRVAFSADGSRVALARADGTLAIYDADGKRLDGALGHCSPNVIGLSFRADGRMLVAGAADRICQVTLDALTAAMPAEPGASLPALPTAGEQFANEGRLVERIEPVDGPFGTLSWLPGGQLLAAVGGASETFDLQAGQRSGPAAATVERVGFVLSLPNGLLHGGVRGRLSDARGGESRSHDTKHGTLQAMATGKAGRLIATGGADGTIALWEVRETELAELRRWPLASDAAARAPELTGLALSPDGTLAYGLLREGDGLTLVRWETERPAPTTLLTAEGPGAMALSPDGRRIALAGGALLRLYDTAERQVVSALELPEPAGAMAFSDDGRRLAVGAATPGGALHLWEPQSADWSQHLPGDGGGTGAQAVAFSPDGRFAAVSTGGAISVWRVGP